MRRGPGRRKKDADGDVTPLGVFIFVFVFVLDPRPLLFDTKASVTNRPSRRSEKTRKLRFCIVGITILL